MSNEITIKQGDTEPPVKATLQDADGDAVDLSDADTVTFQVETLGSRETIVSSEADITEAEDGKVEYDWGEGDTDDPGDYQGEFDVEFVDGSTQTFPNTGYIPVKITRKITE